MPNTDQIAYILFKDALGVGHTLDTRAFFEESYQAKKPIFPGQVWTKSTEIPAIAPVLAPDASSGVVLYREKLILNAVPGTTNSFFHPDLIDAVPMNYGPGYNFKLYDSAENPIVLGQGDWTVKDGLLVFHGIVPANMPPKISFYKYMGSTLADFDFIADFNELSNNPFVQDATGVVISKNLEIAGDLIVQGQTVTLNTQTLEVEDNQIVLNKNLTGVPPTSLVSGIKVNRGSANPYVFEFQELLDTFRIGEEGNTQAVATREDAPLNNGFARWNATFNRFDAVVIDYGWLNNRPDLSSLHSHSNKTVLDGINATKITNWDTAFGWGHHGSQGYLKSFTETDPTVAGHVKSISTTNISNWNAAFGWGNHGSAGYVVNNQIGAITINNTITAVKNGVATDWTSINDIGLTFNRQSAYLTQNRAGGNLLISSRKSDNNRFGIFMDSEKFYVVSNWEDPDGNAKYEVGFYKDSSRLHIRGNGTDGVAQFANYGVYLPQTGNPFNLYAAGSAQFGYLEDSKLDLGISGQNGKSGSLNIHRYDQGNTHLGHSNGHYLSLKSGQTFYIRSYNGSSYSNLVSVDFSGNLYLSRYGSANESYVSIPFDSSRYGNMVVWGYKHNGWNGINFKDTVIDLMIGDSVFGFHNTSNGWSYQFYNDHSSRCYHYLKHNGVNKYPFNFHDTWLRLNQYWNGSSWSNGSFTSGVYVYGKFRADFGLELNSSDDANVIRRFKNSTEYVDITHYGVNSYRGSTYYRNAYPGGSLYLHQRNQTDSAWVGLAIDPFGNGTFTGDVSAFSDARLKDNVIGLNTSRELEKIMLLTPVAYRRKDLDKRSIGLLAQEVEKVYPQLVIKGSDYLSLDYSKLVAPLIAAVQQLNKDLKELKSKL